MHKRKQDFCIVTFVVKNYLALLTRDNCHTDLCALLHYIVILLLLFCEKTKCDNMPLEHRYEVHIFANHNIKLIKIARNVIKVEKCIKENKIFALYYSKCKRLLVAKKLQIMINDYMFIISMSFFIFITKFHLNAYAV